MPKLTIHFKNKKTVVTVPSGVNLLKVLHDNNFDIFSPCGGKGTCGKCKVYLRDEGYITSCLHTINKDTEVILPDKGEAEILVAQHAYLTELPFHPGDCTSLSSDPLGIAVDIGTTTLVFYLVNLVTGSLMKTRSLINPQTRFGADVISRINYCANDPEKLKELQNLIISSFDDQFRHFAQISHVSTNDIVKICISGNNVMLHLLLGVDPLPIALAPYTPRFTEERQLRGAELFSCCNPSALIQILPSVSAYVGADIVAGIASLKPPDNFHNYLYIDIGTNGEMAIVTPMKIWCCATAAGPAFEGANITCGMGAFEGAISFYDKGGFHTIAETKPKGICGSGLVDIVAFLLDQELINAEGFMETDYEIVPASGSADGNSILLTPGDVREVQLAKSAIISGINILLETASLSPDNIDALFIAGGFGNYIRIESACKIGLIPEIFREKVIPVGNASGAGATLSVKSTLFNGHVKEVLKITEYVELSLNENFPLEFAMNMMFR